IIIGSGIAGLFTALLAAEHGKVLVLTKAELEESNTRYAQGGIAAAIAPEDSPRLHHEDTLISGAGLCDDEAVRVLTEEAPARIRDLLRLNVPFDRDDGALVLGLEGAHQKRRILHAGGDATGWHIEYSLCHALRHAGVDIVEGAFVDELIAEAGRVTGVLAQVHGGAPRTFRAHHVVLASGGAGQLFAYTTNPVVATGDGTALAYRAGAELADLEFYQFHPTALHIPGLPSFLISEAVRGEGAYLRNIDGKRFMPRYDPRAELASRDIVARAITGEMQRTGADHVFLDLSHLPADKMRQRFPTIAAFCQSAGLDIATDPLPVAPAAHYMMGGVRTNIWGETSLPGLYACGEVACSGVHGANRLASNSLLEGLVFGARIVQRILQRPQRSAVAAARTAPGFEPDIHLHPAPTKRGHAEPSQPSLAALKRLAWEQIGLVRTARGLEEAIETLSSWQATLPPATSIAGHELHNMILLGWLMATTALRREESRGGHYRSDARHTVPAWRRRIVVSTGTTRPAYAIHAEPELVECGTGNGQHD
ncbi:MAG: L-aspartate oxidase, partial [Gemmatimonadales bacterium]|nr:L-aspartate oxidase [Gemmatimonadales bacterium]